jgi:hypothetical protein
LFDRRPWHGLPGARLPRLHADPFDRLLIAQAFEEPLRLITVTRSSQDTARAFSPSEVGMVESHCRRPGHLIYGGQTDV